MSWNYRVIRMWTGELGVYEVFYDDLGVPEARTKEPMAVGDDLADLRIELLHMLEATTKPVLKDPWPEKWDEETNRVERLRAEHGVIS